MNKTEFSGKNIDETIEKAKQTFNSDDIQYEIIEEGSKGLLGIGSKPCVIKAWTEAETLVMKTEITDNTNGDSEPILEESADSSQEELANNYIETAQTFLNDVIIKMGLDAQVVLQSATSSIINFEIIGNDIALLIGKHGSTLDALQYLADVVAYKKYPCKIRIILDADNHRTKRDKELTEKALKIAEMVVKHSKEAVMEPQNAKERRAIHIALANHPKVKTYSEGDGQERHVVISPK